MRVSGVASQNHTTQGLRIGFRSNHHKVQTRSIEQFPQNFAGWARPEIGGHPILFRACRNRDFCAGLLLNLKQHFGKGCAIGVNGKQTVRELHTRAVGTACQSQFCCASLHHKWTALIAG